MTRKWWAARVTAVSTWLVATLAVPGIGWREALIGFIPLATEAAVSALVPNAEPTVVPASGVGVGPDPEDLR